MAIKQLIALCLVYAIVFVNASPEAEAEAEADADADAYYGYYGGFGHFGHRFGYGGYRPYGYGHHGYHHRRPYFYKPRPIAEYNHIPYKTYNYRTLPEPVAPAIAPEPAYVRHEDPIVVPEPEPVVKSAPAPAPAAVPVHPVLQQERAAYAAFMPVPAVPEDHFAPAVNYMAAPTLPPAPAPVVQDFSRADGIVPVFNNAIPEESLIEPAPEPAPAAPVVEVYNNDIDVIDPAVPVEEAPAAPIPAYATPVEAPVPAQGPVASQYHAQDEFGNVAYGYSNPNSAKTEQRDAYGNVIGSYSYVDDTGYPKHVAYVADEFGFRITHANNFPVGPDV